MDIDDADVDSGYLLGLENKSDDSPRGYNQKLKLALIKRQIVEEERVRLHKVVQVMRFKQTGMKEKLSGALKLFEDEPFIKFYLEVYRELCGKKGIYDITKEVFGRWEKMKRKPRTTLRKINTDPLATYGTAWKLSLSEKQQNDTNQLKFALLKNKIVSEEMNRLANFVRSMNKEKKYPIQFLRTYLKVFREMCGKSNVHEICEEAIKRYVIMKQLIPVSKAVLKMKKKSKKLSRFTENQKKSQEHLTQGRSVKKEKQNRKICKVLKKMDSYHESSTTCSVL